MSVDGAKDETCTSEEKQSEGEHDRHSAINLGENTTH
jgi:hypothetical protein